MTLDEVVQKHKGLVYMVAKRFYAHQKHNPAFDMDDLVQVGFIGLIKGYNRFDESRGFSPSTYYAATIMGEILRFIRDNISSVKVPRTYTLAEKRKKWRAVSIHKVVATAADGDEITFENVLPKYDDLTAVDVKDLIDRTLDPKERAIVKLRLNDLSQKEIGQKFGVSQVQISRDLRKIGKSLQEAMAL